jgi:hypothetical protein
MLALALFFSAGRAVAQRGGGGHGAPSGSGLSGVGRPDAVDEKDELKSFHEAMEVQATSDQASAFRAIVKNTEAANDQLTSFEKENDASRSPGMAAELKESLEKVRVQTKNFVDGLSARQKSGLKETIGRLEKAEAELAEQARTFEVSAGVAGTAMASAGAVEHAQAGTGGRAEGVRKALENLRNHQDRLALEMGIVPSDSEVAFTIPAFKTAAEIGGQRIAISSATLISRAGGENAQNGYRVVLTADLSDLEPNLTSVLSAELNGGERCGERYSVEDATLEPSTGPSVIVATKIYAERWMCTRSLGENEIAQGRGSAEVRATPVVGTNGQIEIRTEMGAVEAKGFLAESLRGGMMGTKLRETIASTLGTMIRATDFKATLPAAGAEAAKIETARFQSTEVGELSLILNGEMRISEEQAKALGNQLKERVSSQAVGTAAVAPQAK